MHTPPKDPLNTKFHQALRHAYCRLEDAYNDEGWVAPLTYEKVIFNQFGTPGASFCHKFLIELNEVILCNDYEYNQSKLTLIAFLLAMTLEEIETLIQAYTA